MINVSPVMVMGLWEDLMDAKTGCNRYGGTVAELYMHRFMGHSPYICLARESEDSKEDYHAACVTLHSLLTIFAERQECIVQFAGGHSIDLLIENPKDPFTHRVHIEVKDK